VQISRVGGCLAGIKGGEKRGGTGKERQGSGKRNGRGVVLVERRQLGRGAVCRRKGKTSPPMKKDNRQHKRGARRCLPGYAADDDSGKSHVMGGYQCRSAEPSQRGMKNRQDDYISRARGTRGSRELPST